MENREAIEWLKGCVVSYEVDNKGKPNGNITCDLTQEVLDMAISALEKQVSMKPLPQEMDIDGRAITPCGFCGEELPHNSLYDFCPYCGQAIARRKDG